MTTTRGIDVSAYQINLPWTDLKNHWVDFAVVKGDQLTATDSHVFAAREAGVDVQLYFWHDPSVSVETQLSWFAPDIAKYKPSKIWLDCEQSWSFWSQYWDRLRGKITGEQLQRVSPSAISNNALGVLTGMKRLTNIPIGIYTGQWFINSYALPMAQWIDNYPLWLASYFDGSEGGYPATWYFINTSPPATFKPIFLKRPWVPKAYLILQYSSRMIAPGMKSPLDWDISYDPTAPVPTHAPVPAPLPVPSPMFTSWVGKIASWATPWVNIRMAPTQSSTDLGDIKPGSLVTILEEKPDIGGTKNPATGKVYTWGRIATITPGWIRLDFVVR